MNFSKIRKVSLWAILLITLASANSTNLLAQMAVSDVGAGIQREALWTQERGILNKMNWYNLLIKALNGDIKGLTGEILGIDEQILSSLELVSGLIKDYQRIKETKDLLGEIVEIYSTKLPVLIRDQNFTPQQAAAILQAFDIILDDSRNLVVSVLKSVTEDKAYMMNDKQRFDVINQVYQQVRQHYGTLCYLYNKILYASYMDSYYTGDLKQFAYYYSLFENEISQ